MNQFSRELKGSTRSAIYPADEERREHLMVCGISVPPCIPIFFSLREVHRIS